MVLLHLALDFALHGFACSLDSCFLSALTGLKFAESLFFNSSQAVHFARIECGGGGHLFLFFRDFSVDRFNWLFCFNFLGLLRLKFRCFAGFFLGEIFCPCGLPLLDLLLFDPSALRFFFRSDHFEFAVWGDPHYPSSYAKANVEAVAAAMDLGKPEFVITVSDNIEGNFQDGNFHTLWPGRAWPGTGG